MSLTNKGLLAVGLGAVAACAPTKTTATPQADDAFGSSEFAAAVSTPPRTIRREPRLMSMAVDGDDVLLLSVNPNTNKASIVRIGVAGGREEVLVTAQSSADHITVDRDDIFFSSGADWDPNQAVERSQFKFERETRMRDLAEPPHDPSKMYKIMRLARGGGAPRAIADDFWPVEGLSSDATWIYVTSGKGDGWTTLHRLSKDGQRRELLTSCPSYRTQVVKSTDGMYWSCGGSLGRVDPDGKVIPFAGERTGYRRVNATDRSLCWSTGSGWIIGARPTGRTVPLARDQHEPRVTCDSEFVFWSNEPRWDPTRPTIVKAPIDGGRPIVLHSSEDMPDEIFVTPSAVGWHDANSGDIRVLPK